MANEPAKKVHWTQTPEGRKRMSDLQKSSAVKRRISRAKRLNALKRAKKQTVSPVTRKKLSALMKARWAAVNSANGDETPLLTHKTKKHALMRASINALAVEGATAKLARLRQECETLEIFIRGVR